MINLELFLDELKERNIHLETKIHEYRNSKEIIYRENLDGQLRENLLSIIRVQQMIIKEIANKFV